MAPILDVKEMSMMFGGLRAVNRADIRIDDGEIVALIGPNGAGKTTFFNCVTGVYNPSEGDILIQAPSASSPTRINGMFPHVINERGLARTFQNIRLFSNMTVIENIMIGRHQHLKSGVFASMFRKKSMQEEEQQCIEESYEILKKLALDKFANHLAKNLPYGAQRRLEIARAMATEPFLLLLDEPAAGMNPHETHELVETINFIRNQEKITIMLIEHDMSLVMTVAERIYVMDYGSLIAEGSPQEIKKNPDVIKAYLGE